MKVHPHPLAYRLEELEIGHQHLLPFLSLEPHRLEEEVKALRCSVVLLMEASHPLEHLMEVELRPLQLEILEERMPASLADWPSSFVPFAICHGFWFFQ